MLYTPTSLGPGQTGLRRSSDGFPLADHHPPQPAATATIDRWRNLALGALAVVVIASFNLFHRLGEARQPIWDESYYLTSTARYELRYASFASHPPLGLMLIAAGDRLSGANAQVAWADIARDKKIAGERMPADFSYWGVRCASAAFGVLATLLFFLLAVELAGSATAGLIASSPFLFDTALITQFRAAQLDSFQLCFAIAALLCLVKGDRRGRWGWTFAFGVACGLATMVRANGILLLIAGVPPLIRTATLPVGWSNRLGIAARHASAMAIGVAVTIAAVFIIHFGVADRAMPAGWAAARADAPYVSAAYRARLEDRQPLRPTAVVEAMDGYRRFMAADVAGVGLKDANSSAPWAWPLGRKAIVYRWDSDGQATSYVALVPNLVAWAVSLAGLIAGALAIIKRRHACSKAVDCPLIGTLLALWVVCMLSNALLAQVRVMYLYHYFLPLLCGWMLTAVMVARVRTTAATARLTNLVFGAILLNFIVLAPFALHRPVTDESCRLRALLNGNALCNRTPSP